MAFDFKKEYKEFYSPNLLDLRDPASDKKSFVPDRLGGLPRRCLFRV